MHRVYYILFVVLLCCVSCEWQLKSQDAESQLSIDRYDRVQSLYLTTGTLQMLINEVEQQYANMTDVNDEMSDAFNHLKELLPHMEMPEIYTQIGSFDQSVVIGNNSIGICLDKYLGADCPLYQKPEYGYTENQLQMMNRSYIVPDCVGFYLLSLYPMPHDRALTQVERDKHIGKIQWVVNQVLGKEQFKNQYVQMADRYMKDHQDATPDQLLKNNNYTDFH